MDDGAWVPKPVDVSRVDMPRDLQMMTDAFAEHFHDSWASRKVIDYFFELSSLAPFDSIVFVL